MSSMAQPKMKLLSILFLVLLAMAGATPSGIANHPSHARCLVKKYKYCYNLEHICPGGQCIVDCVSCKPVCVDNTSAPPSLLDSPPSGDANTPTPAIAPPTTYTPSPSTPPTIYTPPPFLSTKPQNPPPSSPSPPHTIREPCFTYNSNISSYPVTKSSSLSNFSSYEISKSTSILTIPPPPTIRKPSSSFIPTYPPIESQNPPPSSTSPPIKSENPPPSPSPTSTYPSSQSQNPPPYTPPKIVRCKNKNYRQCYNMKHVCPSSYPGGCEDCIVGIRRKPKRIHTPRSTISEISRCMTESLKCGNIPYSVTITEKLLECHCNLMTPSSLCLDIELQIRYTTA